MEGTPRAERRDERRRRLLARPARPTGEKVRSRCHMGDGSSGIEPSPAGRRREGERPGAQAGDPPPPARPLGPTWSSPPRARRGQAARLGARGALSLRPGAGSSSAERGVPDFAAGWRASRSSPRTARLGSEAARTLRVRGSPPGRGTTPAGGAAHGLARL